MPASAVEWFRTIFGAEGWVLLIAGFVSRFYLILTVSLALIGVLPLLWGWHGTVVQSGSMEPHITAGDVVLTQSLDPDKPVPVGRVVQFLVPASGPAAEQETWLHRIVADNLDGTFVTAGDANPQVDSAPLIREQITGQGRLLVPMIGLPGLWLATGELALLAAWTGLSALAVVVVRVEGRVVTVAEADAAPDQVDPLPDEEPYSPLAVFDDDAPGTPPSEIDGEARMRALLLRLAVVVGVAAILAALVAASASVLSSAAFTASTSTTGNSFTVASEWPVPSVTLQDPGPAVEGRISLSADAAEPRSGIRSVSIEYAETGGSVWTTVCTTTTAPYSCVLDTSGAPEGVYRGRAIATSNAGATAVSEEVEVRITR